MNVDFYIRDRAAKLMNAAHGVILTASGNRLLARPFGMPVVELHTIGRRTGQPRSCYLTAPLYNEYMVVLVASKGGDDRHPDWYHNLVARPTAELVIGGQRRPVRARIAAPTEKAELWPRIVNAYKGYENYQKKTDRDIPVVICDFI